MSIVLTNYEALWNKEFNSCLIKYLGQSPLEIPYMKYTAYRRFMKEKLENTQFDEVFFTNYADLPFIPRAQKIHCFFHGSKSIETEVGHRKNIEDEKALIRLGANFFSITNLLKNHLESTFNIKAHVVGFPLDFDKHKISHNKEDIVLWNHRLMKDKNPNEMLRIAEVILNSSDAEFIVTTPMFCAETLKTVKEFAQTHPRFKYYINLKEPELFSLMDKSKVVLSTAYHDMFPTAIIFSVLRGCIPVVPNRSGYPEFFPSPYLYDNEEECTGVILGILERPNFKIEDFDIDKLINSFKQYDYRNVFDKVFNIIGHKNFKIMEWWNNV